MNKGLEGVVNSMLKSSPQSPPSYHHHRSGIQGPGTREGGGIDEQRSGGDGELHAQVIPQPLYLIIITDQESRAQVLEREVA